MIDGFIFDVIIPSLLDISKVIPATIRDGFLG